MRTSIALIVKSRCFRVCDIVALLLACEDFKLLVVLLCGHAWLVFCVVLLTKTVVPCVAGRYRNGFVGVYPLSVVLRKSHAFLLEGMGRKYLYFSREKTNELSSQRKEKWQAKTWLDWKHKRRGKRMLLKLV